MKPKYLNVVKNEAFIRNINLKEVAKKYGTPLYVYDEVELEENMDLFLNNFNSSDFLCHTVYASKALLVPELCKLLTKKGLWMDAVSYGDLYVAKMSNFPMNKVIFHGNNKSHDELKYAVLNNVIIVVDHVQELVDLIKICDDLQLSCKTMFRVNPGINAHTHKYIQTATYVSKFGESLYDDKVIDEIMKLYCSTEKVKLLGFHSHIGSQIQEVEPFIMNVDKMLEFSKKVVDKYNYKLSCVNFGGGFGIPYTLLDKPLDKVMTLNQMVKYIKEIGTKLGFVPNEVFIEPGRSILGNSCVTLYTCGDIKYTYGDKNYQFIDGGMTDNIRPALYSAEYECDIVNKMNNEKNLICDVAGKCCESGDIIIYNAQIPQTEPGDILMVYSTGAYNYSMASNYNNMLKPAVVFLNDSPKLVAKRESLDDLMRLFID